MVLVGMFFIAIAVYFVFILLLSDEKPQVDEDKHVWKYWLLTVQKGNVLTPQTIVYHGNISTYILVEKELGSETNILYSLELTEFEYNYYMSCTKK